MSWRVLRARRTRIALLLACVLGLGWGSFEAVMRSVWLGSRIRVSVVERLEAATGCTVSIERVAFGATRLDLEIAGLVIRGRDGTGEPPLVTVPRAWMRVGWLSLLGGRTQLEALRVHDPRVLVSFGDDGASNIPWPRALDGGAGIRVGRIEITGGSVVWNGEPYGLAFRGSGLAIEAAFDPATEEYAIQASIAESALGPAAGSPLDRAAVEVSATARAGAIEVHRAAFRGESVSVEVREAVLDLSDPQFEGRFEAEAGLAALNAHLGTGVPGLAGTISARGEARWNSRDRQLNYQAAISVGSAAAYGISGLGPFEGNVRGDLSQFEVTGLRGALLEGALNGTVAVQGVERDPQVLARGTVSGLPVPAITRAAEADSIAADGVVDLRIESSGSVGEGLLTDLEIAILPSEEAGSVPLQGSASARHNGADGSILVSDLRLSFDAGEATLRASGSVTGSREARVAVEFESNSKGALERVLSVAQLGAALPEGTPDGPMSFRGTLRGPLGDAAGAIVDGEFSVRNFQFAGQRWDRASFRGKVSAGGIDIRDGGAIDGDGRASIRGTLPLAPGQPLDLEVSGQGFDAGKLARASGFGVPIEGALAIEASLTGSLENPAATSSVRIASPSFFGEAFDGLDAEIRYSSGRFELANALIRRQDSNLRVTGSVDRGTQEITLAMASNRWQLEAFDLARVALPGVTGAVEFDLEASGILGGWRRLTALELDGHWEAAELRRKGAEIGQWAGTISSSRDRQNVDFFWSANLLGGVVRGEATLWQTETPSYSGSVDFREVSASRLWQSLALPEGAMDGSVTGSARFGGVVGAPGTFEMSGTVETAVVGSGRGGDGAFEVSNVFPMRWAVRDGTVRLDSMSLGGEDTDLIIDGLVGLTGARDLDLSLDGTLNLVMLQDVLPGTEWAGRARIGLRLLGTLDKPAIEGSLEFIEADVAPTGFPLRLGNLTGSVEFENGEGRIEDLMATSGGGTVRFEGAVAYRDSGLEYRVQALAEDMRVDYPGSISSIVDGNFTLAGVGSRSILNGSLLISRMSIRSGVSFSDLFTSLNRSTGNRATSSILEGMKLNLDIGSVPQLPVETDLVRDVAADLDLEVVGSVASPSVLGTVGIVQGEIRMLGTHYRINRGDIRFVNPLQAEPVLDVELETRLRDIDLVLVLSGPARSLDLSYRSDPPLPFHDLVSLIVVGKEPTVDPSIASQRRIQQQSLVQTGADALLSQALAEPVNRRLQRFFGVSRIKVDPQIGGLEANPNPRISTEQQIGDDVTLIYSYDLSSAQQQSVRIEWNPDRRWSFLITRDQNGLVGSDVLFKVRLP